MTHSHVCHNSFTCVTWLIHMIEINGFIDDRTHSHAWHDSFTWATWLIYMCDMTHSHGQHDSFTWLRLPASTIWQDLFTWMTFYSFKCMTHSSQKKKMTDKTHSHDGQYRLDLERAPECGQTCLVPPLSRCISWCIHTNICIYVYKYKFIYIWSNVNIYTYTEI